jgi:Protein of unknown function (DUF2917)
MDPACTWRACAPARRSTKPGGRGCTRVRLQVLQGSLWLTLRHASADERVQGGDHFLYPGDTLALLPRKCALAGSQHEKRLGPAMFAWVAEGKVHARAHSGPKLLLSFQ